MTTTCLTSPATCHGGASIAQSRRAMFDSARLLAAYGIVWLHAASLPELQASKSLGRFAVPFFVFGTAFFVFRGMERRPNQTFFEYARGRFTRMYLPFLAWSGIYLAFKLVKGALLPEQPNHYPGIEVFWTGGFYHLWFLPFILLVSLAVFAVGRITEGRPVLARIVVLTSIAAGLLAATVPTPTIFSLAGNSGPLVANALPSVCWAVALTLVCRRFSVRWLEHPLATTVGALTVVISTAWIWNFGSARLPETLAGLGFMVVALATIDNPWIGRPAKLGPLAYGIYLSHLLFIKVFEALFAKSGVALTWQRDLAVFLASAICSTLLAWTLSKWRQTRWLVA